LSETLFGSRILGRQCVIQIMLGAPTALLSLFVAASPIDGLFAIRAAIRFEFLLVTGTPLALAIFCSAISWSLA